MALVIPPHEYCCPGLVIHLGRAVSACFTLVFSTSTTERLCWGSWGHVLNSMSWLTGTGPALVRTGSPQRVQALRRASASSFYSSQGLNISQESGSFPCQSLRHKAAISFLFRVFHLVSTFAWSFDLHMPLWAIFRAISCSVSRPGGHRACMMAPCIWWSSNWADMWPLTEMEKWAWRMG